MRVSFMRALLVVTACGALGACAGTGGSADYARVSCNAPGAVMESPFNSTSNPTEGPLPRAPGDFPCYVPGDDGQAAIASTDNGSRAIASGVR